MCSKDSKGSLIRPTLVETILDCQHLFYFKNETDKSLFYAFVLSLKAELEINDK